MTRMRNFFYAGFQVTAIFPAVAGNASILKPLELRRYQGDAAMLSEFKKEKVMNLTNKAKSLRKNQTDVEQLLWQQLRNRRLYQYKFRRQFPIEPYIADFVCLELKLIIELDGGQHADRINYDNRRSLFLEQQGFKVIRFWNNDVIDNAVGVLEAIRLAILEITERVE